LGGDEFAILLDDAGSAADAAGVADRALQALAAPILLEGRSIIAGVSIGIALCGGDSDASALVRDADTAMYRAKARGGNRHVLFLKAMHQEAVARLTLESELRRALEHDELRMVYQPVVELASGRLAGFEAL